MESGRLLIGLSIPWSNSPHSQNSYSTESFLGHPKGRLTAGLNNPPETLKKTHTLTIRLNPKVNAMNKSTLVFGACVILLSCCPAVAGLLAMADVFATCVPPKAKNRNMKVPANSAHMATSSFRHICVKDLCFEAVGPGAPLVVCGPGAFSLLWRGRMLRESRGMMAV
jgi:hypothetical protein